MREKLAQFFELIYDFRQFITFAALLMVAVIFRCVNFVSGAEFVDLMKNVTVALFAVHGLGHLISVGKDFITTKYQQGGDGNDNPPEDTPPAKENA